MLNPGGSVKDRIGIRMIDQGTITIPSNAAVVFQRDWTSPDAGFDEVRVTATTVRTPVDTDAETWTVIGVNL
jgi:hypothetical protein